MPYEIAEARVRIGLAANNTTRDEELADVMALALDIAERYTDRKFMRMTETVTFRSLAPKNTIFVRRRPIIGVSQISVHDWHGSAFSLPYGDPVVHGDLGLIQFHSRSIRDVTLTYTGGYDPLPRSLVSALWIIFDNLWNTAGIGGAENATGGLIVESAEIGSIKSMTMDGARIEYVTESASGASEDSSSEWGPFIPIQAGAILSLFKNNAVLA